jgi:predicted ArsR family transcriptional regulator
LNESWYILEMSQSADDFMDQVSGIAALNEPARRELYLYVSSRGAEVSRDEAAAACGVSRALAAFHLDKLVDEGLLEPSYRRLTGRTGPGAGRPTKLYRRSGRQVSVSLPPRSYELAAKLFANALDGAEDTPERVKLAELARRFGETVGVEAGTLAVANAGPDESLNAIMTALGTYGYEPYRDDRRDVRMRNCPFHALAREHRGLVCGMNLQLMGGVVEGLGVRGVRATLEPRPNECCVAFRRVQPDVERIPSA